MSNSLWIQELKDRLDKLTSLPRGWDGYNGEPVSSGCAQFAANLIERLCVANVPAPQLVPGADGTLQLEWHTNGCDVEVDVLGPYLVTVTRLDHRTGVHEGIKYDYDFLILDEWIEALAKGE